MFAGGPLIPKFAKVPAGSDANVGIGPLERRCVLAGVNHSLTIPIYFSVSGLTPR
jgi:hypothetical protein